MRRWRRDQGRRTSSDNSFSVQHPVQHQGFQMHLSESSRHHNATRHLANNNTMTNVNDSSRRIGTTAYHHRYRYGQHRLSHSYATQHPGSKVPGNRPMLILARPLPVAASVSNTNHPQPPRQMVPSRFATDPHHSAFSTPSLSNRCRAPPSSSSPHHTMMPMRPMIAGAHNSTPSRTMLIRPSSNAETMSRQHMSSSSSSNNPEFRFACSVCNRRFKRKSTLKSHELIHSGGKPHKCKICGSRFRQKSSLTGHLRTHFPDEAFECQICGQKLSRRTYLRRHLKNVHHKTDIKEAVDT